MTKAEIIAELSLKTGVSNYDTKQVVEEFFELVKNKVAAGEDITVRGFGTFNKKHRAEKPCRNIGKGTTVIVPAHNVPFFTPSKEFKEAVK